MRNVLQLQNAAKYERVLETVLRLFVTIINHQDSLYLHRPDEGQGLKFIYFLLYLELEDVVHQVLFHCQHSDWFCHALAFVSQLWLQLVFVCLVSSISIGIGCRTVPLS